MKIKAEAEDSIYDSMRQIADHLPDFKVYRRIYLETELGPMLTEAYRDVILFARKLTVYIQGHGFNQHSAFH